MDSIKQNIELNAHTALHIDERDIGTGGKLLMECLYGKFKMTNIGCDSKVIQFVTSFPYKLNEEDVLYICIRITFI